MENQILKCSNHKHSNQNQNAIKYCIECNIYLCQECFNLHFQLFIEHHLLDLNEGLTHLFNGFCKEDGHQKKFEYYCETHNQLCCSSCIEKDKTIESSKHKDCIIHDIYDIKENKKNLLENNMNYIEELSNNINEKLIKINNLYEKLNKNNEEIKVKIINIMTDLIDKVKERQNELLLNLDFIFKHICPSEKELKDFGKLQNTINEIISRKNDINKKYYDSNTLIFYLK